MTERELLDLIHDAGVVADPPGRDTARIRALARFSPRRTTLRGPFAALIAAALAVPAGAVAVGSLRDAPPPAPVSPVVAPADDDDDARADEDPAAGERSGDRSDADDPTTRDVPARDRGREDDADDDAPDDDDDETRDTDETSNDGPTRHTDEPDGTEDEPEDD